MLLTGWDIYVFVPPSSGPSGTATLIYKIQAVSDKPEKRHGETSLLLASRSPTTLDGELEIKFLWFEMFRVAGHSTDGHM